MFDIIQMIMSEFDVDCNIKSDKSKEEFKAQFSGGNAIPDFDMTLRVSRDNPTQNRFFFSINYEYNMILNEAKFPMFYYGSYDVKGRDIITMLRYIRCYINEQNKVV